MDRLTEIAARLEAATPGPWKVGDGSVVSFYLGEDAVITDNQQHRRRVLLTLNPNFIRAADTEFIANAPADVEYLLAELASLTARAVRAEEALHAQRVALNPIRLEQLANHLEKWADRWSHNPNTKDYWQSMRREAEYLRGIAAPRPATP